MMIIVKFQCNELRNIKRTAIILIYIEKVDNKPLVESMIALENSFLPITYANKNFSNSKGCQ